MKKQILVLSAMAISFAVPSLALAEGSSSVSLNSLTDCSAVGETQAQCIDHTGTQCVYAKMQAEIAATLHDSSTPPSTTFKAAAL